MTKHPTCGDHGGKTNGGHAPCRQKAGYGTDSTTGRCKYHTPEGDAILQQKKTRVLEVLAERFGTMLKAGHDIGVDPATIWRWRQSDPTFDADVNRVVEETEPRQIQDVEDTFKARLMSGKASGVEYFFYLVNRAPERWRHIQRVDHYHNLTDEERQQRVDAILQKGRDRANERTLN
jgi:hypothetical protein